MRGVEDLYVFGRAYELTFDHMIILLQQDVSNAPLLLSTF